MTAKLTYLLGTIALLVATPAVAAPNCLKGQTPHQLEGATIQ